MKEYLLLIIEYLYIRCRFFIANGILSIIIFWGVIYLCKFSEYIAFAESFHANIITTLGVLLGFSIAALTILLTVDNKNISDAREMPIKKKFLGKTYSLYDGVLLGMAYVVIIQCLLLVFNLVYPIFVPINTIKGFYFFAVNISLLLYTIFCLLREILNFYFIITRNDKRKQDTNNFYS